MSCLKLYIGKNVKQLKNTLNEKTGNNDKFKIIFRNPYSVSNKL